MRVRMLVKISGGRGDGTDWPAPGEELEVDGVEGRHLCAAGLAQPVAEERAAESRPAPDTAEKRAVKPRGTGQKG